MKKKIDFIIEIIAFILCYQILIYFFEYGDHTSHIEKISIGIFCFISVFFFVSDRYINKIQTSNDRDKLQKIAMIRIFKTLSLLVPIIIICGSHFVKSYKYGFDNLDIRYMIFYLIVIICIILRAKYIWMKSKKEDEL